MFRNLGILWRAFPQDICVELQSGFSQMLTIAALQSLLCIVPIYTFFPNLVSYLGLLCFIFDLLDIF